MTQREWNFPCSDGNHILRDVSDRPDAQATTEKGKTLIETIVDAPWGEWSLGFSEVTEAWLVENATPRQA